jgi:pantoate--beta-alanine ligase
MIVTANVEEVRSLRWSDPALTWGFVPTMGALHEGHLSLVRRARDENDRLAVSIYVNPIQFERAEDLARYPRDLPADLARLEAAGVDLAFTPDDRAMYPPGFQTTVDIKEVTRLLEGAARPGHFDGVATVVAKLFNIVRPTRAYFGQKDAQQAVVVHRLIADLNFDVHLVVCPIVRESDGLAMSSRNALLTREQRATAPVLYAALADAAALIGRGERDAERLRASMRAAVEAEPLARLEYVSTADPGSLQELTVVQDQVLLSLAAYFGEIRLIDNLLVGVTSQA